MSRPTPLWYLYLNCGGGQIHSWHKTAQKHTRKSLHIKMVKTKLRSVALLIVTHQRQFILPQLRDVTTGGS